MLVLTRRLDESLVINDNIVITILAVDGDKVKIGVSAPREVPILRQELWTAMREQKQIAQQLVNGAVPDGFEELRNFLAEQIKSEPSTEESSTKP